MRCGPLEPRWSLSAHPSPTHPRRARPAPPGDVPWQEWVRQMRWVVGALKAKKPVLIFTDEIRSPIWVGSLITALPELAQWDATLNLPAGLLHVGGAQPVFRYGCGVRLARFHGVDPAGISRSLSRKSGLNRLLDRSLDCSHAGTSGHSPAGGGRCAGAARARMGARS